MSKSSSKSHPKKRSPDKAATGAVIPDGGIYTFVVGVGAIGMVFWWATSRDDWQYGLVGYLIVVAVLVNLNAWRACQGQRLSSWQQSLARLPLRCAGYGTKGGRPIEAAKSHQGAKTMVLISIAFSVAVLLLLTWLLKLFR